MTVKFKNTEVYISFYFALAITVISFFDKSNSLLFNMFSAMIHESGHFLCMILLGEVPEKLEITPFGMRIERNKVNRMSYKQEILTALSGPCVNFIFAVFLLIFHFKEFAYINIIIGVFNMLFCRPLDGSRVLYFLLLSKFSEERSKKILDTVSFVTVIPVCIMGIYVLMKSGYNFSLLLISIYLLSFLVIKRDI